MKVRLIIATELGFCSGVRKSIDMAMSVRASADCNVTVLNRLVHNRSVLRSLSEAGIGQVSDVRHAPSGKLILSAHGTAPETLAQATERGLEIIDTTCPLVIKVHRLVDSLIGDGYHILVFGDPNHDEVRGVIGHGSPDKMIVIKDLSDSPRSIPEKCALISQTTQDVDDFERLSGVLRRRFPGIQVRNTICKPTRKRQEAAAEIARKCEFVYVVGSSDSANSLRLADITRRICGRSMLVEDAGQLSSEQLEGMSVIGLTAGASSPDPLIRSIVRRLCELRDVDLIASNPVFARIAEETETE